MAVLSGPVKPPRTPSPIQILAVHARPRVSVLKSLGFLVYLYAVRIRAFYRAWKTFFERKFPIFFGE